MDFDLFLTSPRWEILKIIAENPSSPVELAEILNTTVSYMSQQLKLLDAAGLVSKQRTGAAEKGKPRTIFSVSKELVYLTALTTGLTDKKLIYVTGHHKTILKIWLLKNPNCHYYVEKLYWKLEDELDEIEGIFVEDGEKPNVIVVSNSKKLQTKIDVVLRKSDGKIDCNLISKAQIKKFDNNLLSLYDPLNLIKELKGGIEKHG